MKKYILLLFAVAFLSCKKQSARPLADSNGPDVTNYTVQKVWEAGAPHPMFMVDVVANGEAIRLLLVRGFDVTAWEVSDPKTGTYKMYDHLQEWPSYAQSIFYHFSFTLKAGGVKNLAAFQVY